MSTGSKYVLEPDLEGADWQQPRSWRGHWLCCLGQCLPGDWSACCLTSFLPCISFGWSSHRVLHKSLWLEALKYVAVLGVVNCIYFILQVTADFTCAKAAEAGTTHEDSMEREARTVLAVQREQQLAAANTPAGYMLLQAPLVTDAAGMSRTAAAAVPVGTGRGAGAAALPV
ncbi:hypothetical protein OEZ86_006031 [Tetradesmus obliquus]|nr:hypothetical protein OEZ86_006031 [Tetradesmus obliquus]